MTSFYVKNKDRLGTLCKDDASKWAEAFCQIQAEYGFPSDEANMLGWFANAIEIAHDYRMSLATNPSGIS